MHHVTICPICEGKVFNNHLTAKDHTVSHETFQLLRCSGCGLVVTSPRPEETELGNYYLSDAYISHSDRAKTLLDFAYKASRKFTLRWKHKIITSHCKAQPCKLLDFGCGTGDFLRECQKQGMEITGVEPSDLARTQAIKKTGANIVKGIAALNEKFDAITLWHVLEHVADLNQTMTALKQSLHENGTMFIALPNLQSQDAQNYGANWAGYDVPRHLWHFSHTTIELLLQRHGLKLTSVIPMKLDAYYVSLLSEKYRASNQTISTILQAVISGFRSNNIAKKNKEYSSLIYIAKK